MLHVIEKYYENPYWTSDCYQLGNMYLKEELTKGKTLKDALQYAIDNVNSQIAFDVQCEENIKNGECLVLTETDCEDIFKKIKENLLKETEETMAVCIAFEGYLDIFSLWSCGAVQRLTELIINSNFNINITIRKINELIREEFEDGQCYKASKNIQSSKYDTAGKFLTNIE